jgi:type IV pilus assembly protein PilC
VAPAARAAKTFEYTAIGPDGTTRSQRIEAPNERAVAAYLRERGLLVTAIEPVQNTGLNRELKLGGGRIKPKDTVVALRQLATMVNSGLSLVSALTVLAEQTDNPKLGRVIREIAGVVENGGTLAEGFAEHPEVFDPVTIAMIRAGEEGGFLDQVLNTVAETTEKSIKLRHTVKSAMTYPVLVLVFAVVVVIAMLLFIVPIFSGIFESLGSQLPAPTRVLVWLSDGMKVAIWPVLAVAVVGGVWWRRMKNAPRVRAFIDPKKLGAPLFGELARKMALSRFCRNFATMTRVGVPVVHALDIVGATAGNTVIEAAVKRVRAKVVEGVPIGRAMEDEPVFPAMIRQMIAVGEDAGALDQMLDRIAGFYDDAVESATASLTSMIEPLLIIFVGSIVGALLIALYLPIFQLSTAIG